MSTLKRPDVLQTLDIPNTGLCGTFTTQGEISPPEHFCGCQSGSFPDSIHCKPSVARPCLQCAHCAHAALHGSHTCCAVQPAHCLHGTSALLSPGLSAGRCAGNSSNRVAKHTFTGPATCPAEAPQAGTDLGTVPPAAAGAVPLPEAAIDPGQPAIIPQASQDKAAAGDAGPAPRRHGTLDYAIGEALLTLGTTWAEVLRSCIRLYSRCQHAKRQQCSSQGQVYPPSTQRLTSQTL